MQWIVSSSVLILVVIALRYVLRGKLSLRMQYALWLLVLVRLLVPVSFGASDLSVMNAVPERAPTVQQGTDRQDIVGERNDAPANAGTVGIPAQSMNEAAPPDLVQNVTTATVTAPTVEKTDWARIAKTVWLAGAAALGLVFLAVNLRFGKKLRRSRERVEETDACLPVYESGETDTPCLFGVAKPSIYVTPDTRTEAETLRYALAHEQTHYPTVTTFGRCCAACVWRCIGTTRSCGGRRSFPAATRSWPVTRRPSAASARASAPPTAAR